MANTDVQITLEQAVAEVLTLLTGVDLTFNPAEDTFHVVARCLNRAMRSVALEHEWSYYSSTENVGTAQVGVQDVEISSRLRPRIIGDDAVRLQTSEGKVVRWAYILPRDALHKYGDRSLRCSITRSTITFSRPFVNGEQGLSIMAPVMREPRMFLIPASGQEPTRQVLDQLIDFDYPDLVMARAAYIYAQADPVLQPRVPALEEQYKDIMYQLVERDERHTDTPYMNDFFVPIEGSINGSTVPQFHHFHPHSDERYR